jgi:hypothetical protein
MVTKSVCDASVLFYCVGALSLFLSSTGFVKYLVLSLNYGFVVVCSFFETEPSLLCALDLSPKDNCRIKYCGVKRVH